MAQSKNRDPAIAGGGETATPYPASRGWIGFAALSGGVAVIAGAFAAHGLDPQAEAAEIGWLRTGSLYEALHALAMLMVASLATMGLLGSRLGGGAQWAFTIGNICFPTALYGLALHGPRWLGAVAPIGGMAFIIGWIALSAGTIMRPEH